MTDSELPNSFRHMSNMLGAFFEPYIAYAFVVSSALLKNTEAVFGGLLFRGIYLDATLPLAGFAAIALGAMLLAAISSTIASAALSKRWLLPFVAILWIAPGLVGCISPGWHKSILAVDAHYVVGGAPGVRPVGSLTELLASYFLMFCLGWALSSLVFVILRSGKRFRLVFEHLWLIAGLGAAGFLLLETESAILAEKITETDREVTVAASVLSEQMEAVHRRCGAESSRWHMNYRIPDGICKWAIGARHYPNDIKTRPYWSRQEANFESYLGGTKDANWLVVAQQKLDLEKLNNAFCQGYMPATECRHLPDFLESSLYSKGLIPDLIGPGRIVTIEPLFKLIHMQLIFMEGLVEQKRQEAALRNKRWLYFFFFSVLVGIKAATVTREIFYNDSSESGPSWYAFVIAGLGKLLLRIQKYLAKAYNVLPRVLKKLLLFMQMARTLCAEHIGELMRRR